MEELRCRFLGVVVGDENVTVEVTAAVSDSLADGEGLSDGESNSSGRWVPFLMVLSGHGWRWHGSLR